MQTACLKLREDLIISEQTGPDGTLFVIKDPQVDRFFRFKALEHFIAKQFDGATSLDTTRQRVAERFGIDLSSENLEQFTTHLQGIGLLTNGAETSDQPTQQKSRIAGDMFYLRFKLFDPDRLFDRLLPGVRFLFTPTFVVTSAMITLLAIGITVTHTTAIMHQFYGLFRLEFLVQAWCIILVMIMFHEFAHGLTCKYFGGHVRDIGFMLIFFQPAFYCNVSDAWLFPEKSKRMWVTFAGGYFEIFLWAVATVIWWVTDPTTTLNHFALLVTATSAFKTFINMNPLIKLDGYYLLSDWLDVPNLRQKASSYLNILIRKIWSSSAELPAVTPRERSIFLIYATLSGMYIYWILSSIALWFGSYLVDNYQGWGFIAFTSTLGVAFRKPIGRMFSPVAEKLRPKRPLFPRKVILLVGLIAILAALYYGKLELKVSGSFTVLPLHNTDVRAEVEGIIEEIYVKEGEFVEAGAPVARLSDRDFKVELQKVEAEIEARQAEVSLLKAGARPEEIELAKMQVSKARELLNFARAHLDRDQTLVDKKYISLAEYERTKELVAVRTKELQEAREKLKLMMAGSRKEEIEALNATIRSLEAHRHYLQTQLKSLEVVSPANGVVTTPNMHEKIGEAVKKGDLIAEVFELKTLTVKIAVPEKEISEVKVGQRVTLKAQAYPHEKFEGEVLTIAPVATKPESEWESARTVAVTTQLENTGDLLKPEMTGYAKIYCGERALYELMTHRFVRYIRVTFWSWW
jgi:putative peptide zinc metalloprotease protein